MRGVSACKAFTSLPVRAFSCSQRKPRPGEGTGSATRDGGDRCSSDRTRARTLASDYSHHRVLVGTSALTHCTRRQLCRQPHDQDHLLQIVRLGPAGRPDGARAVDHTCRGARLRDAHPDRTGGVFEVRIDDEVICSRKERGRFPEIKKIKQLMRRPRSRARVYGQP
jgi:selT/selW/selH-like putative selenoprotein